MSALSLVVLSIIATTAFAGIIPDFSEHHQHHEEHLAYAAEPIHHIPLPPAISTFSFISLNPHKPTSYSGFTNHGHGHHDPGYAVQFRQDGYALPHEHHHAIPHEHHSLPLEHHSLPQEHHHLF